MDQEIKYCIPTRFDTADFGTLWKVMIADGIHDTYIQLSKDTYNPRWEKISYMLEKSLERYFDDNNFIAEMLKLYEGEQYNFFER